MSLITHLTEPSYLKLPSAKQEALVQLATEMEVELPSHVPLGITSATNTCLETLGIAKIQELLARHHFKDYGELCEEDVFSNEKALIYGRRIVSAYHVEGEKVYVITEPDRSVTTALFAYEY